MDKIKILSVGTCFRNGIKPNLISRSGRFELNKPRFGLYGSTLISDEKNEIWSSWLDFVDGEDYHKSHYNVGVIYTLKDEANIYTVDSFESYKELLDKYSIITHEYDNRYDIKINWNKFAKYYDAFHLTLDAFYELRMLDSRSTINGKHYKLADFYAYDCETWIIFSPNIINLDEQKVVDIKFNDYEED